MKETQAECHARSFPCWSQFVSVLLCQLGGTYPLREITRGLRSRERILGHLGMTAPSHSSLAHANAYPPWRFYQEVFLHLLPKICGQINGKKKTRFKNALLSLDVKIIDLCVPLFYRAKFQRAKGAIILHPILDHEGYLSTYASSHRKNVADVKIAQGLRALHLIPEPSFLMIGAIMTTLYLISRSPRASISSLR